MKTMKRKLFRLLPLMVAAVLFMVSCSSKDEGTFIPKNASFVCHIDVASLWEKGDLANADNLKMVQSMRQNLKSEDPEFDQLVGAILKDPNSCGIDFRQCATSKKSSTLNTFGLATMSSAQR